jgi:exodeoxyribonuclease VII large subunit
MGRRMQRADELDYQLRDAARVALQQRKRALDSVTSRLGRLDVRLRFAEARRRLEAQEFHVKQRMRLELNQSRSTLTTLEAHLRQLSPLKILDRGYAIVERDGSLVKSPDDAPAGSDLRVRLAKGELRSRVLP